MKFCFNLAFKLLYSTRVIDSIIYLKDQYLKFQVILASKIYYFKQIRKLKLSA